MVPRLLPRVSHFYRQHASREQFVSTCRSILANHWMDSFGSHDTSLHTSAICQAGGKWRQQQGLPRAGTEYGPLTDTPDWSYADGRPGPPSKGALKRKDQQRELAIRIDQLAEEVLSGKERYRLSLKALEEKELDRQSRQLKPKGIAASDHKRSHFRGKKVKKPVQEIQDV